MDKFAVFRHVDFETSPPHVLVVDDDPVFVEMVSSWLKRANYRITAALSGREALEVLGCSHQNPTSPADETHPADMLSFDLVLLDVMMPGIQGTEVCRRIRATPHTAQLPVLILTALVSSANRLEALEAGANDHLTKPFEGVELLARVGNLVRWYRAERKARSEIQQRNRELNALNQVTSVLNQTLDLSELAHQTLATVCQVTGFACGAVFMLDSSADVLELVTERNMPAHLIRERIPRDRSLMWQVIEQMRPMASESLSAPPDALVPPVECELNYNIVLLASKGKPVGLLTVGDFQHATPPEMTPLLEALGHQIGTAIENSRLYVREQQRVAELVALTQELEHSQAQLIQSEKMAAAGRLAASLAHEINNPLQAIHNCLTLAQRFPLETREHDDFLKLAGEEVERLIDLVRRILEFCRPSRGHRLPTDINELIRHVVALSRKKLLHSDIELHLSLAPEPVQVPVIADQVSQVILNLIVNAVEAMPDGGRLELNSRQQNGWVEIQVTDHGPGLSEAQIDHLFEPFFTTKPAGTGLGLAISFGIIERHGGTISVSNTSNAGASFVVRLPINATDERSA